MRFALTALSLLLTLPVAAQIELSDASCRTNGGKRSVMNASGVIRADTTRSCRSRVTRSMSSMSGARVPSSRSGPRSAARRCHAASRRGVGHV